MTGKGVAGRRAGSLGPCQHLLHTCHGPALPSDRAPGAATLWVVILRPTALCGEPSPGRRFWSVSSQVSFRSASGGPSEIGASSAGRTPFEMRAGALNSPVYHMQIISFLWTLSLKGIPGDSPYALSCLGPALGLAGNAPPTHPRNPLPTETRGTRAPEQSQVCLPLPSFPDGQELETSLLNLFIYPANTPGPPVLCPVLDPGDTEAALPSGGVGTVVAAEDSASLAVLGWRERSLQALGPQRRPYSLPLGRGRALRGRGQQEQGPQGERTRRPLGC